MFKQVYFRVDGDEEIGYGHVVRCLAIAHMLKKHFKCTFIVKDPNAWVQSEILKEFDLTSLNKSSDLLEEATQLNSQLASDAIIVIDHYAIQTDYRLMLANSNRRIVCIDDLIQVSDEVDLVFNHSIAARCDNYPIQKDKLKLGIQYSMLRPPFLKVAELSREITDIKTAFVCFGGADIFNLSTITVKALLGVPKITSINVVIGPNSNQLDEITRIASLNRNLIVHQSLDAHQMMQLMKASDLAIAPSSSLSYEICSVGMAFISGYYIDNQIGINSGLDEIGCILNIGEFQQYSENELTSIVSNYIESRTWKDHIQIQKRNFNGDSQKNIIECFESLAL